MLICYNSNMKFRLHNCSTPDDREQRIREKIEKDDELEGQATGDARLITEELLGKLGFLDDEIIKDMSFEVSSGKHSGRCSMDYIIKLDGRYFMAIKCSMAVDSRERHVLSFCRAAHSSLIPVGVVTDGLEAHIIDAPSGRQTSESVDDIPSREQALEYLKECPETAWPEKKAEAERRILLAFETTLCPRTEGG